MTDKILTEIEAKNIVKQKLVKHPECCGFTGNLDEVLNHAQAVHNTRGRMANARLDGSVWNDDDDNSWISAKTVYKNAQGYFWFVCLETHVHKWAKDESDPAFPKSRCIIEGCDQYHYGKEENKNDPVGNFKKEQTSVAFCEICGEELLTIEELLVHLAKKHGRD